MSIYETLYELIVNYIFGAVEYGTYQELICILLASVGCIFVFAIPFVLVFKIIKIIVG